jgi:hypothetical protein
MLRIKYTMAIAAFLLLQVPSSFAAEYNQHAISASDGEWIGVYANNGDVQVAASTFQGESDQLASSDPARQQQQPVQPEPTSAAMAMEYPALALLAMAIISMAALSRRDSFRIDR